MASIDTVAAVHHPVRRRIIDFLVVEGPSQVGTLARALQQQVGSISHHLRMLERAGVVERAPELAEDGRTSWWRFVGPGVSWSVEDFVDSPADRTRAEVAERLNFEHHVRIFVEWQRRKGGYDPAWRRAAFTSDMLARATPAELADLQERLTAVVREWRGGLGQGAGDGSGGDGSAGDGSGGDGREPVFVFTQGVPVRP